MINNANGFFTTHVVTQKRITLHGAKLLHVETMAPVFDYKVGLIFMRALLYWKWRDMAHFKPFYCVCSIYFKINVVIGNNTFHVEYFGPFIETCVIIQTYYLAEIIFVAPFFSFIVRFFLLCT